ncbi:MAG: hypothetical protein V1734_07235 [Nanoarchaeota archaeon]
MRKYVFLLAIMLVAVNIAYAQNECEKQNVPEGFKCIEGSRGFTVYNEEQMNRAFGANAEEIDGLMLIKYMQGRSGERGLGYLFGTIAVSGQRIMVTDGGFISTAQSRLRTNITGGKFYISITNLPLLEFALENATYSKEAYTILCEGKKRARYWAEEEEDNSCSLKAKVNTDSSYADINGQAVAVLSSKAGDYMAGNNVSGKFVTKIKGLSNIEITNKSNFTIKAVASGSSIFGKMTLSGKEVMLAHIIAPDDYYMIAAKKASIVPEAGANLLLFAKNREENAEGIKIMDSGRQLLQLSRGYMVLPSEKNVYEWCASETFRGNAPPDGIKSLRYNFATKSCGFIDNINGRLYFKPRTYNSNYDFNEDTDYPFNLKITLPAGGEFTNLEIKQFETFDLPSSIILEKEGLLGKQLVFTKTSLFMPEGALGNWYDFEIGFSTYIYYQGRFRLFECNANTQVCKIDGDVVFTRTNPFNAPTQSRCSADTGCRNGNACIEKLCVIKNECEEVQGVGNIRGSNKLDILFLGDATLPMQGADSFSEYVLRSIDKNGNKRFNGLLTVRPFSEQASGINFWQMYGEQLNFNPEANALMALNYLNSMKKKCARVDNTILLSRQIFTPFSAEGEVLVSTVSFPGAGKGLLIAHEFGHSIGGLRDEYLQPGTLEFTGGPNCLPEDEARRKWQEALGSSSTVTRIINEQKSLPEGEKGCGGYCGESCRDFMRPSIMSIMNKQMREGHNTFNDVSRILLEDKLKQYS